MHGAAEDAAAERARLLAWYRDHRETADGPAPLPPPDRVTVGQLLTGWLAADHPWRPSTLTGYRSVSRGLLADPLARCPAQALTPQQVRQAIARWRQAGAGIAVVDGRFRVLRSCLSWAYNERHLDTHPLRLMRGPGRILTVGADTAALWHSLEATWTGRLEQAALELSVRVLGPWVFTADLAHHRRLGSEVLGHRFERVREAAGVPDATLHRLRHTVATFLVSRGLILQAQARLGHGDAATTLREYAHALPGTDAAVADAINANLDLSIALRRAPSPVRGNDRQGD